MSSLFAVPLDIRSLLRTMAGAQWIATYPQTLPCFCPALPTWGIVFGTV
jgi:hypothetical protein